MKSCLDPSDRRFIQCVEFASLFGLGDRAHEALVLVCEGLGISDTHELILTPQAELTFGKTASAG